MPLSKTTKNHREIRRWAESRNAVPAEVGRTGTGGETGILRLEFPRAPHRKDSQLREISWDEFFEKFDESNLEFVYQEKTAGGAKSNFNKLVHPENGAGSRAAGRSGSSRRSTSAARSTSRSSSRSGGAAASSSRGAAAGRSGQSRTRKSITGTSRRSSSRNPDSRAA